MEMFFLVLKLGYGVVVMPDKYSKAECEYAGKAVDTVSGEHLCVPVPEAYYNCARSEVDPNNNSGRVVKAHCDPPVARN